MNHEQYVVALSLLGLIGCTNAPSMQSKALSLTQNGVEVTLIGSVDGGQTAVQVQGITIGVTGVGSVPNGGSLLLQAGQSYSIYAQGAGSRYTSASFICEVPENVTNWTCFVPYQDVEFRAEYPDGSLVLGEGEPTLSSWQIYPGPVANGGTFPLPEGLEITFRSRGPGSRYYSAYYNCTVNSGPTTCVVPYIDVRFQNLDERGELVADTVISAWAIYPGPVVNDGTFPLPVGLEFPFRAVAHGNRLYSLYYTCLVNNGPTTCIVPFQNITFRVIDANGLPIEDANFTSWFFDTVLSCGSVPLPVGSEVSYRGFVNDCNSQDTNLLVSHTVDFEDASSCPPYRFQVSTGFNQCILDADGDGVSDGLDLCPETDADQPDSRLGVNRFADIDSDGVFETVSPNGQGPGREYTMTDTAGCSCRQIINALNLGTGHSKFGCSISAMDDWTSLVQAAQ